MNPHKSHTGQSMSDNASKNKVNSRKITVRPVETQGDLKLFYKVPFEIYKDIPQWVPPFWFEFKEFFDKRNPFWKHAKYRMFLVYSDHILCGRIAAVIDDLYCKTYREKTGFFGFFECIDDFSCAEELFTQAEKWLASNEMDTMMGPIDGRIDVGCGFLYNGFDDYTTLLSTYNPEYYISFCKQYNLKKCRDFYEYYIDLQRPLPLDLVKKAQQCSKSGINVRAFKRFRTNHELKWWISLFLETFDKHWGYVPVSENEVRSRFGVKQLRWTVDPGLFLIAEKDGKPIAYLWGTPEFNQVFRTMNGKLGLTGYVRFFIDKKTVDIGKLHLIGIKENLRHHNIGSYLNYLALLEMQKRGYKAAIIGSIDEHNKNAHDTIKITGARIYKKFRVFEKQINSS